jgi:predicted phage-related endonuclease
MPDPDRRTLSATESPALFNASPYVTRWMLYHKFANGVDIEKEQTSRMFWGKELQPLLLKKAADDLKLEIYPNGEDVYERHPNLLIGCTRDALIYDPARGYGSLETKAVFDYGVWMREWGGGQLIPRHYEIQLQHQMLVGGPTSAPFNAHSWGVLAVWVCGEMMYFERAPIEQFQTELRRAVGDFFLDVARFKEPEPFGSAVEVPLLTQLFDGEKHVLECSDDYKLAEIARLYKDFSEQHRFYEKGYLAARLELLKVGAPHYELMRLAGGVEVKIKKTKNNQLRIRVKVPDELPDEIIRDREDE